MYDIAAKEREQEEIRRKEENQIIKERANAEEKANKAEEKAKKEAGRKARRAEEEAGRKARREAGRKARRAEEEARREAAKTAKAKSKQARTASGPTTRKNILERLRRQFTSSTGNNTNKDEDEDKDTYASPEESDPNIRKAAEEEAIRKVKRITEAEESTTPIDANTKQKMNEAFKNLIKDERQDLLNKIISEHKKLNEHLRKINLQVNDVEQHTRDNTYNELIEKFYFSHKNKHDFIKIYTTTVNKYKKILCKHNINNKRDLIKIITRMHSDKNRETTFPDYNEVLECKNFGIYCGSVTKTPKSKQVQAPPGKATLLLRTPPQVQAPPLLQAKQRETTDIDNTQEEIDKLSKLTKESKLETETLIEKNNSLRDIIINSLEGEKAVLEEYIALLNVTQEDKSDTEKEIANITEELDELNKKEKERQEKYDNSNSKLEATIQKLKEQIKKYNTEHDDTTDPGSGVFGRDTKSKQQHELELKLKIQELQHTNIREQHINEELLNQLYEPKAKKILEEERILEEEEGREAGPGLARSAAKALGTSAQAIGSALASRLASARKYVMASRKAQPPEVVTFKRENANKQEISPELPIILSLLSSILIPLTNSNIIYPSNTLAIPAQVVGEQVRRTPASARSTALASGLARGFPTGLVSTPSSFIPSRSSLARAVSGVARNASTLISRTTGPIITRPSTLESQHANKQEISPELPIILSLLSSILIPLTNSNIIYPSNTLAIPAQVVGEQVRRTPASARSTALASGLARGFPTGLVSTPSSFIPSRSSLARAVSGVASNVPISIPQTAIPTLEPQQAVELDPRLLNLLHDFNKLSFFQDQNIKKKLEEIDNIIDEITSLDELNRRLALFNISISTTNISIFIPEGGITGERSGEAY